jgi:alpha-methylacyl-CoA racemase
MRPLEGIRVLDLSRLLPGPLATLVLADLGAEVDKVDEPEFGSSFSFDLLNRGKRSLAMNLKAKGAADAFKRLAVTYDVVLEQFRPGVMQRLGIGHPTLLEANPRLVVCALTGYGQNGPLSCKAGHDLNYLARAGVLGFMGPEDRPPQVPAFQLADVGGGLFAAVAILAALRERDRTGKGTFLDMALTEAVIPFATLSMSRVMSGDPPSRGADVLTGGIAAYNTYATKDGTFVALAALEPKFLERFCKGAGLAFDPMALVPGAHQPALKEQFAALFAGKTRAEWEQFSQERDCCLEPVLGPDELLGDEQLRARGVFVEAPGGTFHAYRTPVTPRDLEPQPAPRIGEHSDAILLDGGFAQDEIAALRDSGIVR